MTKLKLIYFSGCPHFERARSIITKMGFRIEEINQSDLPVGHKYKNYSSPTVLDGDRILYGSRTTGGSCSIGDIESEIKSKLLKVKKG